MPSWYVTEFVGTDNERYAGPRIMADSHETAQAMLQVLRGPNGQEITLLGELAGEVNATRGAAAVVVADRWGHA